MLSLQAFKETMDFLKEYNDKEQKISDAMDEYNREFLEVAGMVLPYANQIERVLAYAMDEKNFDICLDEIGWWTATANFGRDKEMNRVYIKNVVMVLDTTEKFYNYLVDCIKERSRKPVVEV